MRVAHVITNLDTGGAQVMLRRLVLRLETAGARNHVIALAGSAEPATDLLFGDIPVACLHMASGVPSLAAARGLRQAIAAWRADVVQTWLYHADFLGGIAARAGRLAPVVWGLHHAAYAGEPMKRSTRWVVGANARLSRWIPERIVCCAHAARTTHEALGYAAGKMVVIPNGFDTEQFRPDPLARVAVRGELGVPLEADLVTMVARVHPHKDHRTFIRAAAMLTAGRPTVQFLLAGDGVDHDNVSLGAWIAESGLAARVHLVGTRHDVPRLMAASDVVSVVSTSTEALPLVLGEAMACGIPCVATNVGDCARLIGDTGDVVPPGDADALARAWGSVLSLSRVDRTAVGERARHRVCVDYSLAACVRQYANLYEDVRRSAHSRRA